MLKTKKHPIAFSTIPIVEITRDNIQEQIALLEPYRQQPVILQILNYGLEVSVNYKDGKLVSVLANTDSIEGEVIPLISAEFIFPLTSVEKQDITLRAIITLTDVTRFRGGITKLDIASVVKDCLVNGFGPYESKQLIVNPVELWVGGIKVAISKVWPVVGNITIGGTETMLTVDTVINKLTQPDFNHLIAPQYGFIITDNNKIVPDMIYLF